MKKHVWADEIWPRGTASYSKELLQSLDDDEFDKLRRMILRREQRSSRSPSRSKKVVRKIVIRRRAEKRVRYSKEALLARFQDSEILECLVPNRKALWRKLTRRRQGVRVSCKNFSLIDNPIATLNVLRNIAVAECEAVGFSIDFEDRYVDDVGPYLLLGAMRQNMAPVTAGGRVSGPIAKVLEAVGLHEFLRMRSLRKVPIDDVWPLPLRERRASGTSSSKNIAVEPTTVEITADQLVRQVDSWLGKVDPPEELTLYGSGKIKGMIGEILNNAERHGRLGGDGDWVTAGFMARRQMSVRGDTQYLHICHLSLMNTGRSFAETIRDAPAEIVEQIDRYASLHQGCGLSANTLSTVFAMQDGISRILQGDGNPSGGTGMMDIVEFANEVGRIPAPDMRPKVVIISGRSYIKFDGAYSRGQPDGTGRRLQWFNPRNDVMGAPDNDFVMDLPYAFPGTLITMRFVLDGQLEDDGNGEPHD